MGEVHHDGTEETPAWALVVLGEVRHGIGGTLLADAGALVAIKEQYRQYETTGWWSHQQSELPVSQ